MKFRAWKLRPKKFFEVPLRIWLRHMMMKLRHVFWTAVILDPLSWISWIFLWRHKATNIDSKVKVFARKLKIFNEKQQQKNQAWKKCWVVMGQVRWKRTCNINCCSKINFAKSHKVWWIVLRYYFDITVCVDRVIAFYSWLGHNAYKQAARYSQHVACCIIML